MNGSSSTQKTTGLLDLRLDRRRLEWSPMSSSVQNTWQWVKVCVVIALLLVPMEEALSVVQSGRPLFKLKHHRSTLRALSFQADGKRLASMDGDGNLAVWGLSRGELQDVTRLQMREIRAVTFTSDLTYALVGTDLGVVQWVSVATGSPLFEWRDPKHAISQVAVDRSHQQLAWASRDGQLWWGRRSKAGTEVSALRTRFSERVVALKLRVTGKRVEAFVGLASGELVRVDLNDDREIQRWIAHTSRITCLNFSADTRYLTSCARDGGVSVWASDSGKRVNEFKGHPEAALDAVISPKNGAVRSLGAEGTIRTWARRSDGERDLRYIGKVGLAVAMHAAPDLVAMSTWDNTIELWRSMDAFKSKSLELDNASECLSELKRGVWAICDGPALLRWNVAKAQRKVMMVGDSERLRILSRRGGLLILGGEDRMLRVWSLKKGRELWRSTRIASTPSQIELNAEADAAMIGTENGQLYRLGLSSGQFQLTPVGRHSDTVVGIGWNPAKEQWVTAGADRSVLVWSAQGNQLVKGWRDLPEIPFGLAVDGVGNAWIGVNRSLWRYHLEEGTGEMVFESRDAITALDVDDGGEWAVIGRRDGYIDVVNTAQFDEVKSLWGHRGMISKVSLAADRRSLASVGGDGRVQVMDIKLGLERFKWHASDASISVALPLPKKRLLTVDRKRRLKLWNRENGKELSIPMDVGIEWLSATVHEAANVLGLGTTDGRIFIYELDTMNLRGVMDGHDGRVESLAISPNGKFLASGGKDKNLKLWSIQSLNFKTEASFDDAILALDWGPKGKVLALASKREIFIVDSGNLSVRSQLSGHKHVVSSLNFSPRAKSNTLVSGGFDLSARAWNTKEGKELWLFGGNGGGIRAVDFSPDGEWVVTACDDGTVKTYSLVSGQEQLKFIGHKGRVFDAVVVDNGKSVVSAGEDGSIRVWAVD